MLLSAVSVLVVAQSSSEFPEGLMNNPVLYEYLVFKRLEPFEEIHFCSQDFNFLSCETVITTLLEKLTPAALLESRVHCLNNPGSMCGEASKFDLPHR